MIGKETKAYHAFLLSKNGPMDALMKNNEK